MLHTHTKKDLELYNMTSLQNLKHRNINTRLHRFSSLCKCIKEPGRTMGGHCKKMEVRSPEEGPQGPKMLPSELSLPACTTVKS